MKTQERACSHASNGRENSRTMKADKSDWHGIPFAQVHFKGPYNNGKSTIHQFL